MVSLWKVDDDATAELMTLFYRGMITRNERPAAALRSAQLELRRDPRSSLTGPVSSSRVPGEKISSSCALQPNKSRSTVSICQCLEALRSSAGQDPINSCGGKRYASKENCEKQTEPAQPSIEVTTREDTGGPPSQSGGPKTIGYPVSGDGEPVTLEEK